MTTEEQIIVSDQEIAEAFKNTNFGHSCHRELLNASVFKKLLGYHCGHTITKIMTELKLIGKTGRPTKRGVKLLRDAYSNILKVSG